MGAAGAQVWGRCGRVWEVRWAFNHVSGPSVLGGGRLCLGVCSPGGPCETVSVCVCVCVCSAYYVLNRYVCKGGSGGRGLTPSSCFRRVVPETSWGIDPDTPYSEGRPEMGSTHCPV